MYFSPNLWRSTTNGSADIISLKTSCDCSLASNKVLGIIDANLECLRHVYVHVVPCLVGRQPFNHPEWEFELGATGPVISCG